MADQCSKEGASTTANVAGEASDATVELNIKTLDSRIYSLRVDRNMPISAFKEKIADQTGIPVGQQRLIFRGRIMKDDRLLSDYQVENGHTLHLVPRQHAQSQPSSDSGSADTSGITGNDASGAVPRSRIGQISHSVVLGTFNVGDQGDSIVPDLNRVIGAVLNSFGIGGQGATNANVGAQFSTLPNASGQAPQGNETGGSGGNAGGQGQEGNRTQSGRGFPGPFSSLPQAVQIPLTAAMPVPTVTLPIPDSLSTLSEFMTRMEQALAQNGYQPNMSSTNVADPPRVELPSDARGLPTPEALSIVLRHAERLLSGHAIASLSHIARRLEQEGTSADADVRGQIQNESVQVGLAMQHLGALLLELGRTILTLRMGRSPAESSINAGPAVYISPAGPNPIMAQPFPFQTNSLLASASLPSNPMTFGPVGIGNAPRNINIHIHAGTPLVSTIGNTTNNGERMEGERSNSTGSGVSGSVRVLPVRNVIAATVPGHATAVPVLSSAQPGLGVSVSEPPSNSVPLSSLISEINSQLRNFVGGQNQSLSVSNSDQPGMGVSVSQPPPASVPLSSLVAEINSNLRNLAVGENQGASGSVGSVARNAAGSEQPNSTAGTETGENESNKKQGQNIQVSNNEGKENLLSSKDVPSGPVGCSSGETSQKSEEISKDAPSSSEGTKAVPLGLGALGLGGSLERKRSIMQSKSMARTVDSGTSDAPRDQNLNPGLSGQQVLLSLASRSSGNSRAGANDALSGQVPPSVGRVIDSRPSEQPGSGSPNVLSNMIQQLTQDPEIMSTVSQIAQRVDRRAGTNNAPLGQMPPLVERVMDGRPSGQSGIGSPNLLSNMLQQITQNPQIMNTVSQIAQQVDSRDLENMFSGSESNQSGGIDLARMMQQMMPVVSQVFSGGSAPSGPFSVLEPQSHQLHNERSNEAPTRNDPSGQIDLQGAAQAIESFSSPRDVFHAVLENAARLNGNGNAVEDIMRELTSNDDLASDYIEMLRHDLSRRLEGGSGADQNNSF